MSKTTTTIYFQVRLKKAQTVDGTLYRKGHLLCDKMNEAVFESLMKRKNNTWEDVIGHGNSNYFDNEDVYFVKVSKTITIKTKTVRYKPK